MAVKNISIMRVDSEVVMSAVNQDRRALSYAPRELRIELIDVLTIFY